MGAFISIPEKSHQNTSHKSRCRILLISLKPGGEPGRTESDEPRWSGRLSIRFPRAGAEAVPRTDQQHAGCATAPADAR